jgi:hypothetical protein
MDASLLAFDSSIISLSLACSLRQLDRLAANSSYSIASGGGPATSLPLESSPTCWLWTEIAILRLDLPCKRGQRRQHKLTWRIPYPYTACKSSLIAISMIDRDQTDQVGILLQDTATSRDTMECLLGEIFEPEPLCVR